MVSRKLGWTSLMFIAFWCMGERKLPAGVIFHSDLAHFQVAAGTLPPETFSIGDTLDVNYIKVFTVLDSLTNRPPVTPNSIKTGVKFTSSIGKSVFLAPVNSEVGLGIFLDSSMLFTQDESEPLILDFTTPSVLGVAAAATDLFGFSFPGSPVDVTWSVELDNNEVHAGTLSLQSMSPQLMQPFFLGWTTTGNSRIRQLKLAPAGGFVAIDNVRFGGELAAVPEPASVVGWSLLAGALVIAGGIRHGKRIRSDRPKFPLVR